MTLEAISDTRETDARKRGAYTTPDVLAQFLVSWAVRSPSDLAIDSCCGDGVFLEAIANRFLFLGGEESSIQQITGVEIDASTAKQSHDRLFDRFKMAPKIIQKGFFATLPSLSKESYDAVVGNPPFVRYRHFFEDERELAWKFLRECGFKASKLTNAWVPFLVAGIHLLKTKGRLAMIMPAELFQVSYAAEIREYLLNDFGFVFVVAFNNLVFPDVEQEVVLLMGTKGEGKGLRLIEIKDESELITLPQSRIPQIPVEDSKEKWTQYFLTDAQRRVLRKALSNDSIKRLDEFCSVDVGIVTGGNDFFVLSKDVTLQLEAQEHFLPLVTRTKYFKGLVFAKDDWEENMSNNYPSYLLAIEPALGLSDNLKQYIAHGEQEGWHKHFKCRNREPWYVVPSIWIPDAFLFRQIGSFPRLILNSAKATCTDTLHRVKFKKKEFGKAIIGCFHNSLTFAFAEIFGRSYGGGVLELMPTEAEKLPVPIVASNLASLLAEMDGLVREGSLHEAVDLCDRRILIEELGFKKHEIMLMRSAWQDLSKRRKSRKRR